MASKKKTPPKEEKKAPIEKKKAPKPRSAVSAHILRMKQRIAERKARARRNK